MPKSLIYVNRGRLVTLHWEMEIEPKLMFLSFKLYIDSRENYTSGNKMTVNERVR